MNKGIRKLMDSKFWWLWTLLVFVAINYIASDFHLRFDLTKEKRYTLSSATKELLMDLDDDVKIEVFLKGEFPSGFRKLANSTTEFLRLLKDRSAHVQYKFISPQENVPGTQILYGDSLAAMGAIPINLTVQKEAGQSSNIIFPVAVITYKGRSSLVTLYPGANRAISQIDINNAEALMEYQFANALDKLSRTKKPTVAYSRGNGEPTDERTYDLVQAVSKNYQLGMIDLNTLSIIPDEVDVLMIVKPSQPFTESEKFKIDQFVMRGGKLLCFIDNLYAEQDSLAFKPETIAYDRNLNLTNLFFRYGLRINTDLLMDLQCDLIPIVAGGTQENPQLEFVKWNYYPLLVPAKNQSINKSTGYVAARFANSIDTIAAESVSKIPLLVSSPNSRTISTPALISINENKNVPEDEKFNRDAIPVAMLLQGNFTSLYRNRVTSSQVDSLKTVGKQFIETSAPTQMIVVADGDMVLNDFTATMSAQPIPLPMGWNRYTYVEYEKQSENGKLFIPVSNHEFVENSLEQLVNSPAISQLRNKEIVLRLLDSQKVSAQRTLWQFLNIGVPVVLILLFGFFYQEIRKRKYS